MAIIPAGFALTVFFNRANLIKKIQGQPTPQLNIVLQIVSKYSIQDLIQISSLVQPVPEGSRFDFRTPIKFGSWGRATATY